MLFVTYGEQNRGRWGETGRRELGSLPPAYRRPQRQPEEGGAEEDGEEEGGCGRHGLGGHALLELFLDLARLGEAAQFLLGEDKVVADGDLEDASVATDQLGLDAELLLDFSRQTGGTGVVVSARAVLDGDTRGHSRLLSRPL
jgi:hypothetical protein